MKRTLSSFILAVLLGITVSPQTVLAEGVRFQGNFALAASANPNSQHVAYCGGEALALNAEAHGNGSSSFGPLTAFLQKTIDVPGPMHGCLTLSTPDGDTLSATYDGTEEAPNANNFVTASGTLTFTGGTGLFAGAKGTAAFTAVFDSFYPDSSFLGGNSTAPLQVMAFYTVNGKVFFGLSN
jgi:hypothetical protein